MGLEPSYIFYSYNDSEGHGIPEDILSTYADSLIFDSCNRTIYARGGIYGNHQMGSYHGEVFNDYNGNDASGDYSSASGYCTYAGNKYEFAVGCYNKYAKDAIFSVGNGNSDVRSNALEVHYDATYIKTPAYVNGDEVAAMSYVTAEDNKKVDKVDGKELSSNDFTDEYKEKLDSIAAYAEVNVQADWAEDDNSSDSYINNKPTNLVSMLNRITSYYVWVGNEEEYEALEQKYSNVIYIVTDNEEEQELPEYVPQNG